MLLWFNWCSLTSGAAHPCTWRLRCATKVSRGVCTHCSPFWEVEDIFIIFCSNFSHMHCWFYGCLTLKLCLNVLFSFVSKFSFVMQKYSGMCLIMFSSGYKTREDRPTQLSEMLLRLEEEAKTSDQVPMNFLWNICSRFFLEHYSVWWPCALLLFTAFRTQWKNKVLLL